MAQRVPYTTTVLPRHADLHALRVAERVRFLAQVVERADDPAGDVKEGQAAGLAAGVEQALGQLRADGIEDLRTLAGQRAGEQLVQALVAQLGQLAGGAGTQQHLADVGGDEQAHLADELAGIAVPQHKLAAIALDADDAQRAADDVVQGVGRVARAEDVAARRVATPMALVQEMAQRQVVERQRTGDGAHVAEFAQGCALRCHGCLVLVRIEHSLGCDGAHSNHR